MAKNPKFYNEDGSMKKKSAQPRTLEDRKKEVENPKKVKAPGTRNHNPDGTMKKFAKPVPTLADRKKAVEKGK